MIVDFGLIILAHLVGDYLLQNDYIASRKTRSHIVCLLHVVLYTFAFFALVEMSGNRWPWISYGIIAAVHYLIDRYSLARWWMDNVSNQSGFARNMGPWSVIVVDNIFHLLTAFVVWRWYA